MKALIIGAAGFVGKYLIEHIHDTYDWEIHATKLPSETLGTNYTQVHDLDICLLYTSMAWINRTIYWKCVSPRVYTLRRYTCCSQRKGSALAEARLKISTAADLAE